LALAWVFSGFSQHEVINKENSASFHEGQLAGKRKMRSTVKRYDFDSFFNSVALASKSFVAEFYEYIISSRKRLFISFAVLLFVALCSILFSGFLNDEIAAVYGFEPCAANEYAVQKIIREGGFACEECTASYLNISGVLWATCGANEKYTIYNRTVRRGWKKY